MPTERKTNATIGPSQGTVPKVTGADVELGNFISGDDDARDGNASEAARRLLREVHGFSRNTRYGNHGYSDDSSRNEVMGGGTYASGNYSSGGSNYYPHAQDWGRKFLPCNGGCVYIDLNHLEICIPECLDAFDHVAAFNAMLRITRDALHRANDRMPGGQQIKVTVNNTDGQNSWGSHLNFLITRKAYDTLFNRKIHHLLFLGSYQCSAIALTGSGKVGAGNGRPDADFQISSRADYYETLVGSQTTVNRPLVNSRDEGLVGLSARAGGLDDRLARLHCIFFDATLNQVATLLKVGMTQIVLAMIEQEVVPAHLILDDPLETLGAWSRDPSVKARGRLVSGGNYTVAEHAQAVFDEAQRFVAAGKADDLVPKAGEIVRLWGDTLQLLRRQNWDALASRCDWVAKHRVLSDALRRYGVTWNSPQAKHLDQVWAKLDLSEGLYWACDRQGAMQHVVTDGQIERFVHEPPEDTRAWFRAQVLRRADEGTVDDVDWDKIVMRVVEERYRTWTSYAYPTLAMPHPLGFTRRDCEGVLTEVPSLMDAMAELGLNDSQRNGGSGGRTYASASAPEIETGTTASGTNYAIVRVAGAGDSKDKLN